MTVGLCVHLCVFMHLCVLCLSVLYVCNFRLRRIVLRQTLSTKEDKKQHLLSISKRVSQQACGIWSQPQMSEPQLERVSVNTLQPIQVLYQTPRKREAGLCREHLKYPFYLTCLVFPFNNTEPIWLFISSTFTPYSAVVSLKSHLFRGKRGCKQNKLVA